MTRAGHRGEGGHRAPRHRRGSPSSRRLESGTAAFTARGRPASPAQRLELFRSFLQVRDASYTLHMTGGLDHDFAFAVRNR
jgi:hypothetical protein